MDFAKILRSCLRNNMRSCLRDNSCAKESRMALIASRHCRDRVLNVLKCRELLHRGSYFFSTLVYFDFACLVDKNCRFRLNISRSIPSIPSKLRLLHAIKASFLHQLRLFASRRECSKVQATWDNEGGPGWTRTRHVTGRRRWISTPIGEPMINSSLIERYTM